MIIAIDHGNKQIKTENYMFLSGFQEYDNRPPFGTDILKYDGKYYVLSSNRFPYMRDKTIDNRFFILTLFAIGKELDRIKNSNGLTGTIHEISLPVGLPPKHFSIQHEGFRNYFLREKIDFVYNEKPFTIHINDVAVYPQAFAAVIKNDQIVALRKVILIDLGGFTIDYLQILNGKPDLSVCDSLDGGIISFYQNIISDINSQYDLLLGEDDIDSIIKKEKGLLFSSEIKEVVEKAADEYICNLIGKFRERNIDLRSLYSVWMGGASILLQDYISCNPRVGEHEYIKDIHANARGYKYLYEMTI